jgi:hypothetical protein
MRFRLRPLLTLLVVGTAFAAVSLAVVAIPHLHRASRQRAIVEHVESLGGAAYYDWQLEDRMGPSDVEDFVREFTSNRTLFANVVHIDLSNTRATDADLAAIEGVYGLEWLAIANTAISEEAATGFANRHPPCSIRR